MNALNLWALPALMTCIEIGWASDPLDTWTSRNPLPTGNTLYSIVFGNGQFVAVGDVGTIVTSADGTNWVAQQSGTPDHLSGVTYANGQFVAVGFTGTI